MMMNYRPIWTISDTEVGRNAQVFATVAEAEESAKDTTEDEVTYERIEGVDHRLCTT